MGCSHEAMMAFLTTTSKGTYFEGGRQLLIVIHVNFGQKNLS